ncbi:MAG: type II toxin-antitoxin system RelE/ParE family toxin [Deltaproteobacteria bacterium]|nr:type II toxin-antitoxin system RelE/ParE family toxin [Deltaproteobacteria bacterium]
MRLVLHHEASAELAAAAEWYERQGSGLGDALLDDVTKALVAIAESPRTWPRMPRGYRGVRRFVLARFPYGVVYVERPDHLLVAAIAHTSREPGYWRNRLRGPA